MPRLQNISKYWVVVTVVGLRVVERVGHRDAFEWLLLDPLTLDGCRKAGGLEQGRRDVDHVVEVRADLAARLDARRASGRSVPFRVPPQCDATCFVHWYGVSIACAQPTAKWL